MHADHEIHLSESDDSDDTRQYWECSCGKGGSVDEFGDPEAAADKHIPEGESRMYVSKPRW
jgi:hypothetical protein